MKQFCMKIDRISQGRENALFLPSNMAAMTSHENALYFQFTVCGYYYFIYTDSGKYLNQKSELDLKKKPDGYLVRTPQALDTYRARRKKIDIVHTEVTRWHSESFVV